MSYLKQLSPGVQIREIDLTNFVPTLGNSGGATVGQFVWGPVNEYVLINDANTLAKTFGKPNDTNYVDWFSAANFLAYNDNLKLVRVVSTDTDEGAKNSSVDGTGIRVDNKNHYQILLSGGSGTTEIFVARYPGVIGDSLKVSICDSATYENWTYRNEFDFAPGTSKFAANLGASNDEVHVVIVDEDGKFTGIPGSVLEKYAFLSKALDSKGLDNEPNFYGNIINNLSNYVWYFSPIKGSTYLDIENGIDKTTPFTIVSGGTNYGKPIFTFEDTDWASGPVGTGASARAILDPLTGEIIEVVLVNPGSGYTGTITCTITDSGEGATASVTTVNGVVTQINPLTVGKGYYKALASVVDQGSGGGATAVLSATGSLKTVTLADAGTGYTVGDTVTVAGGTGTFVVASISGGGATGPIATINTIVPGSGYAASGNDVATSGGTGSDATVDIVVGKTIASYASVVPGSLYGPSAYVQVNFSGGNPTTPATATATIGSGLNLGKVTGIVAGTAGEGYETAPTVTVVPKGTGATITPVLGVIGSNEEGQIISYTINTPGTNYGNPKVVVTPAGSGASITVNTTAGDGAATNWAENCADSTGNPRTFYSLLPGDDNAYSVNLSGGQDGVAANANDIIAGWDMFKNSEEVDVGLLFVGNAGGSSTAKVVIKHVIDNIAEYRRDCMVFFSPNLIDTLNKSQSEATRNVITFVTDPVLGINRDTSFAVCDSGWKLQYDVFSDKYRWIPLNADIAGLCAQTETDFDAWWSPAGLNRGKIKNIISLAFNPNKASRDELYKRNINSVVSFTGEGTILYGDRTLQVKNSAFSYINVRRLFIVLEKSIGRAAKYQLFEFNDTFTRNQFVGMITPYLRTVQAKRGIYDFKVVCDESNNTPDVIDSAQFIASIFIKPARSINFITLNFVAVRTGVEFSEVVGVV